VVGIESAGLAFPGNVVLDKMSDAGLAAPYLETVAIPR
jgi:hypothetical protein